MNGDSAGGERVMNALVNSCRYRVRLCWAMGWAVCFTLLATQHGWAQVSPDYNQRAQELFGNSPVEGIDLTREKSDAQAWQEEARQRSGSTRQISASLERTRKAWHERSKELDQQLNAVVVRYEKDAKIRQWANAFRFLSKIAAVAAQVESLRATYAANAKASLDQKNSSPKPSKTNIRITNETNILVVCPRIGDCNVTPTATFMDWLTRNSHGLQGIANQVADVQKESSEFPSVGCGGEFGVGCALLNNDAIVAYQQNLSKFQAPAPPPVPATSPSPLTSGTAGSDATTANQLMATLNSLRDILPKPIRPAVSILMDIPPLTAVPKSAVEAATGMDPITGEPVPKLVAAAGLAASTVPFGKVAIRIGGKIAVKSAKKAKIAIRLAQGLKGKIKDVGVVMSEKMMKGGQVVAIELKKAGKVFFKMRDGTEKKVVNQFRHYTSSSNAKKILKEGVIKVGDKKTSYATRIGKKPPVTKQDAIDRLGVERSKGDAFVEFNILDSKGGNTIKESTLKTKGRMQQFEITGDVNLESGAAVFFRNK